MYTKTILANITVEPLLMATHLGPSCIEVVLIKPLVCGHPSIVAKIFGTTGGHYRAWGSIIAFRA